MQIDSSQSTYKKVKVEKKTYLNSPGFKDPCQFVNLTSDQHLIIKKAGRHKKTLYTR